MKKTTFWVVLLGGVLLILLANVKELNMGVFFVSAAYGVLLTVFLLILIWGFTRSQLDYIREVENVKHQVLEVEGIICSNFQKKKSE